MMNMNNQRVNKRVFLWSRSKSGANVRNWCYRVELFYRKISMHHLLNESYDFNVKDVLEDIKIVLSEFYEVNWFSKLTQDTARNGLGGNKLRTYRKFKNAITTEPYLKNVLNKRHRSALAKFRCGVASIRIETGRYEHLQVEERLCPVCCNEIENEEHVLTRCSAYMGLRNDLYTIAFNLNPDFNTMSDSDKLCYILSNTDISKSSAKTCHEILHQRRLLLYSN